jgi:hypothetical protein
MATGGAGRSEETQRKARRAPSRRWAAVLVAAVAVVSQLQGSPAQTQTLPPIGATFQARICQALQSVQATSPVNDLVRQVLAPFLAGFGCTAPPTSVPSTTTTITFPPTTSPPVTFPTSSTSSTLPPCPATTTTTVFPSTTIPCQPAAT